MHLSFFLEQDFSLLTQAWGIIRRWREGACYVFDEKIHTSLLFFVFFPSRGSRFEQEFLS
jgi:hypothetical protein